MSPYLPEIERECLEWSASFNAFDPETQRLVHDKGKLSRLKLWTRARRTDIDVGADLLAGMCYARMSKGMELPSYHDCRVTDPMS